MSSRLQLQGIGKVFRSTGLIALEEVTLQLPAGQAVALVGPNGSGKSTLLRIAAGLILPDRGKMVRDDSSGVASLYLPPDERGFYARLSLRRNLQFYSRLFGVDPASARRRLEEFCAAFPLAPILDRRYDRVSSGQKRLLGLALVRVLQPGLLLLDEPLVGLDPQLVRQAARQLRTTLDGAEGAALLLATQQMEVAAALADRVILLKDGKTAAQLTLHRDGEACGPAVENVAAFYERAMAGQA